MPRRPTPAEQQEIARRRLADLAAHLELQVPDTHTRVRPPAVASVDPAPTAPPAPPEPVWSSPAAGTVPVPGRHASRRVDIGTAVALARLGDLVPEPLRGRAGLAPVHVAVVLTLVVVGLVGTCWVLVARAPQTEEVASPRSAALGPRDAGTAAGDGDEPTGPAGLPTGSGSPGTPGSGGGTAGAPAEVVVDVAGKVRRPGIVVLPVGSRVVDALEAAGGPRRGVSTHGLNLARLLVDGEQLLVGVAAVPGDPAATGPVPGTSAGGAPAGGLVSLNGATLEQLDTLPGVGPVTAQAILDWRTEHGAFTSVEELLEVDGIGDVTLEKLRDHVTL